MNESELETLLRAKMKSCIAGKSLPEDFTERLIGEIRRARRAFRRKMAAAFLLSLLVGAAVVGFMGAAEPKRPVQTALIAAAGDDSGEEVSGWVLLGALRECFKRARNNKRKEED